MNKGIDLLKRNLIIVYAEYKKYSSPTQFMDKCPKEINEIIISNIGLTLDIHANKISLGNSIKTAFLLETKIATEPTKITAQEIQEYSTAMEKIIKGDDAYETLQTPPRETQTYVQPDPKQKPKKRAVHIKKGTSELQTQETLNTRILRAIRAEPQKNPYKQQHSAYFRARIEEQNAIMQTPNLNPRRTQEQKDAYYAFQTNNLTSSACAASKWSGLEKECEKIREEFSNEPNYDSKKLLEFYGIEMTCLKIIHKEELPDKLAKIMHELL